MQKTRHLLARDTPDSRDYLYRISAKEARLPLPRHVDLSSKCPRVWNQGSIGTCTAHAVGAAFAYEQRLQKMRVIDPSRLFIFYNERILTGQRGLHAVVYLRDALKAVAKHGVCPESHWSYAVNPKKANRKPSKEAFAAASTRRVFEYHRIAHSRKPAALLRHLKRCLADGSPFVFGIEVYASLETPETSKRGIMPTPDTKHEKFMGGHAVIGVGYDDRKKAILVRNSWGPDWGIKGYFWIPYKLITNSKLAHDFWTIRGVVS